MRSKFRRRLLDTATAPFKTVGRFTYHFARGKLSRDPIFFAILKRNLIPDGARIVDLGCGQGVLPAWLFGARDLFEDGQWPQALPTPPRVSDLRGVELMPRDVARAQKALGGRARFEVGDIRTADFGQVDVVAILDSLHYIDYPEQEAVLSRAWEALAPGGRLITRFGDAAGGVRFRLTNWVDRSVAYVRGHRLPRLYCRSLGEWRALLEKIGFRVETFPMNGATPFANVMVVGDRVER